MAEVLPVCLKIQTTFPTERLAAIAMGTLSVDEELSKFVRRKFTLIAPALEGGKDDDKPNGTMSSSERVVLQTDYEASTDRMLRVAVNGYFENLALVLQVMRHLDEDVIDGDDCNGDLEGVQGVEVGLTGNGATGG
ncbi:Pcc1-domain-containing protein [Piedraia hortae CBS 480.64]|uniref:Pcc1-domain-containing protein n=1 Tax=Piedraia hortae CBS 480.64 TaxID=1314780 RepID=A0A6A7BWI4_9PEZI|nr:Pcc1-domain-containing protein [Piedraia hortae CBS 480.64]